MSSSLQRRPLRVVGGGLRRASGISPRSKFFLLYTSDVFSLAEQHGFFIHGYADDLQIYQHCFPQDMVHLGSRLTKCVENIESWMSSNRLRLNVTKTEFLWLGSLTRRASNPPSSIQITGSTIAPSKTVRSLGVLIDPAISFREQIAGLEHQHLLLQPLSTVIHPPVALVRFESCSGTCINLVQTRLL